MIKHSKLAILLIIILSFVVFPINSFAEDNEAMKQEVEALKARVAELENSLQQERQNQNPQNFRRSPRQRPGFGFNMDPFEELNRMQEEMDRIFEQSFPNQGNFGTQSFSTGMMGQDFNLQEEGDQYVIRIDISGLNKKKLDVEVNQNSVSIKGEYNEETREENKNGFFQSKRFGTFFKTIPLPIDADASSLETKEEGDVLILRIYRKKV